MCVLCIRVVVGVVRNFFSQFGPVVEVRARAIARDWFFVRGGRDRVFVWSMCVWVNSMHGWCGGLDYTRGGCARSRSRSRSRLTVFSCGDH